MLTVFRLICVFRVLSPNLPNYPEEYAKPRGALLMALVDGKLAGCCALRPQDEMESARALYQDLGFEEILPYYHNPIAGSHYLKAKL